LVEHAAGAPVSDNKGDAVSGLEIAADLAVDADWAGGGVIVAASHDELVWFVYASLMLALCEVGEQCVCVVPLRHEDYRPPDRADVLNAFGQTDSEMFNCTSTLNIRSRNDSLAVLVYAVCYLRLRADAYADVLN